MFPRLYALAPDPGMTVRAQWSEAWTPALPQTLSDQRLADLLSLQSWLAECCPSYRARDMWVWCSSNFSARAVYRLLCGQETPEDPQLVRRSRLVQKQRLLRKIRLFRWLLLRRHIMTRSLRRRFDPEALTICPLCNEAEEDCIYLFFQCPLVQAAWRAASVGHLDTSSDKSFGNLSAVVSSAERRIGNVSLPLYGQCGYIKTRSFSGVDPPPPDEEIVHDARGFALSWHQGGLLDHFFF